MSLDAIGIVSHNIKSTIKFYDLLGVSLKELGGANHYEGTTQSGVRIMVDSIDLIKQLNSQWIKPQGSSQIILCFKQSSPQSVNELYFKITSAGYTSIKEPWNSFWGQRYCIVEDPDGNQIDIFAALATKTNN